MTTLLRLGLSRNLRKSVTSFTRQDLRCISTSKKNRDTAAVTSDSVSESPIFKETDKNWISYGFSHTDKDEDRRVMHAMFFFGITVCIVFGGFGLAYRPDELNRDWAQREAYLELRRREKLNLPLVDPDYLPLDKIKLPTDEELGDREIII